MNPIYAIKAFSYGMEHGETLGFFYDKNKAIQAVERNACDIYEGISKYAVVLTIFEGLFNPCDVKDEVWFGWDDERQAYVRCNRPKFAEHWRFMI